MTTEYHKIDSVFKRDERGKFLIGEFSRPEFEYLADNPWLWTEKIDGTNIRVIYNGKGEFSFGGKTDNAQIPTKLYNELNRLFGASDIHEVFGDTPATLYGEGYGAGIQSGGNYSPEQKFILFDVNIGGWWLQRENVEDIAHKLGLDVVPLIAQKVTLSNMIRSVADKAKQLSEIPGIHVASIFSSKASMEGYVGTPLIPLFARNGDRIITKVKYKDFR